MSDIFTPFEPAGAVFQTRQDFKLSASGTQATRVSCIRMPFRRFGLRGTGAYDLARIQDIVWIECSLDAPRIDNGCHAGFLFQKT